MKKNLSVSIKSVLLGTGVATAAIFSVVGVGRYLFHRQIGQEIAALSRSATNSDVTDLPYERLATLPAPVQRYLSYAVGEGQPVIHFVRLRQSGQLRQGLDQPWMPIQAEQYFTTDTPAFIWRATASPAPMVWFEARDKYVPGQSNMLVKLFSTVPVADAAGPEMDQSSLLRFLSEMPWFPSAFLSNDYLQWEAIDANTAKVTISHQDISGTATFYFNDQGQIIKLVSEDRYRTVGKDYVRQRWTAYYRQYREIKGLRIPVAGEVVWNSDAGDFSYAKLVITDIEYNVPLKYS